jgi:heavy metal sensor kinase
MPIANCQRPISMPRTSIQRRLIAAVLLSQLVLAAGLLFAGVYYTRRRLLSTLDAGIQSRAMSVAALVRYNEDATGDVYFDNTLMPPSLDPAHPDLFAVWTERSGLLVRSANWPAGLEVDPRQPRAQWDFTSNHLPYRALRVAQVPVLDIEEGSAFHPQTLTIFYAAPMLQLRSQLKEAAVFITLASVSLLLVAVLLAYWGIRRGLLPLQNLAGQAALVSAQNWEFRVPEDARQIAELRPLTESMAQMLGRLERSFVQQREFLGNAAHELKTPVAVLKSTLQSLLQKPRSSEEYRAGLEHSLEDLERLERLLQWMLRLARAEQWAHGALRRDLPSVDLASTCEEAADRMRGLADSAGAKIHLAKNGAVTLQADPEDLQLVWINLLENAVRYTPPGGAVEVAIGRHGGFAQVVFADQGPGIGAEDLPHVFDRFYRGDPSRARATGGFGLGLAIAKALVEAYGGSIRAESAPGEGTRMTVELPAK